MRRYLKDLTKEELRKVWNANEKLQKSYCEQMYEDSMQQQYEDGKMFLEKAEKYYDYHDYYQSFFFTLRQFEGYHFLNNMIFSDLHDYSIVTDEKIEECKKYMKLYEDYDYSIENNEQDIDKIQDKLDELATEVLKGIEKYLHEYEDIDYGDAFDDFYNEVDFVCENVYIKDDTYIAYEDYTKCYA
jgi:hypothetical protein